MAVLRNERATRGRVPVPALIIGVALALVGCVVLQRLTGAEDGLAFPHRVHVVEEGLDCTDCHVGAEDSDEPGMPIEQQCMLCHADMDEEAPEDRRVATLFADGKLLAAGYTELGDEVIFSHSTHVDSGMDCSMCHGDLESSDALTPAVRVGMADCVACHENLGLPTDCATCHSEIDLDWQPPSHAMLWEEHHGGVARSGSDLVANDCSMCHTEDTCASCHSIEPPRSHTQFWRRRGHFVAARMDRASCATCHNDDFCFRCHQETQPINHVGMWGGTQSLHCVSCHFPLSSNGCATCHQDTPSHLNAAPQPASHSPGADCRQCHGLFAPLPHVDKGDDCSICHL